MQGNSSRIILAADELRLMDCERLLREIGSKIFAVKIHNLWDQGGPRVVEWLLKTGAQRVWVDAKLHDIPNTVALRAKNFANAGAFAISVHASGGPEMMQAAVESGLEEIYAITVLTSLEPRTVKEFYGREVKDAVADFAQLAANAGVHGVVCSPREVEYVLAQHPELRGAKADAQFKLITPGIRSEGQSADDQKRTATASAALRAGATHLVIGRKTIKAVDPIVALEKILAEIDLNTTTTNP